MPSTAKIKFQGIKADVPAGIHGLWNPERGLRLEVALDVAARNHAFHPDEYPGITTFLDEEMRKYASDSISLVQTYFYLTGYIGRNISEDGFNTMELFSTVCGPSARKRYCDLHMRENF